MAGLYQKRNGDAMRFPGEIRNAIRIKFNNLISGLQSTNVQGAIDETNSKIDSKLPFGFGVNSDGEYGYIKVGADTVTPF